MVKNADNHIPITGKMLLEDVFEVLKRQQAEKKELWEERNRIYESLKETESELKEYRTAYVNAQAEIKRLNAEKDNLIKTYGECMTEAIKEFAERLCDGMVSNDTVVIAVKTELKMTE